MTEPRRFLDVWIVETNTIYREVPFSVVADWVQQGRLLEDDMLRPSGTAQWFKVGASPAFAAYLPRAEPYRAEDQAEALEPVHLDFAWKRRPEDEEDDVDMIPLIDISLVLLIFFMMTATVVAVGAGIEVPPVEHGAELDSNPQTIWIGIDRAIDGAPIYSLGLGEGPAKESELSEVQVLRLLDAQLKEANRPVRIRVAAHRLLPYEVVRQMIVELELRKRAAGTKVERIIAEVGEYHP
jgi:biopolymer transport protein ExbD